MYLWRGLKPQKIVAAFAALNERPSDAAQQPHNRAPSKLASDRTVANGGSETGRTASDSPAKE